MTELEAQLRAIMQIDAKVYRARNSIAEATDPVLVAERKARKAETRGKRKRSVAGNEPDNHTTEEPSNEPKT